MFESFNDTLSHVPILLLAAKLFVLAFIIGLAASISYWLVIFLIWYHFSTSHPFEVLVIYFTIFSGLGMWYLAGVLYGKVWRHEVGKE